MHGSRANGLLAAALASAAFLLAVNALTAAGDSVLVALWWPSTALLTALLIKAPPRRVRLLAGFAALVFLAAALLAGRGPVFAVGFAVANTVEAMLVLRWLTGFDVEHAQLRSWTDYRRLLVGIGIASGAAGAITAMTIGITGGQELWRPMVWIAITHLGAQAVVLPLFMRQPRFSVDLRKVEVAAHVLLLLLGGLACFTADGGEPVAFLLLPLLMWSAARFTPQWASIELLVVSVGVTLLTVVEQGPFAEVTQDASLLKIAASSPTFVAVSAITSVAFSVAMAHLRDSLRRIREHELQLGQLLDSASGTAFIATDLDGLITWFSPGAEELLGYTAEEVVGLMTPVPFHERREILSRAKAFGIKPGYGAVTHLVALGEEQDTRDWTYICKDGTRLMVSLSATAVRNDAGKPISFLSVVRDVTDRRAAEQALVFALDKERETNHRMLELDRAKGDFVSAVSHELRTPLTSIVGYTELLADDQIGNLTQAQLQLVERIDRNGERLLHLVEDLLTLARVEDGSFTLDRAPTDLRSAVRAGVDEVALTARQCKVRLSVRLPSVPVSVDGDHGYLERLVLNLVGNAVKFTDEGGLVEVELDIIGDTAELTVSDNGMGIPLEEQGRLFERFFRSSLATQHAIQGTGLGLHIVRSIAEAHDGRIDFQSTPGVGTLFRFTVPLTPGSAAPAPAQQPTPQTECPDSGSEQLRRADLPAQGKARGYRS